MSFFLNDVHIINPYNSRNRLVSLEDINSILCSQGIKDKVLDITLWQKALTHKSYIKKNILDDRTQLASCPKNCLDLRKDSNETLEFLGDSIIGEIVAEYLFHRFPECDEGIMTKLRTKLVCGNQLSIFSYDLGLHNLYLISSHVEDKCEGRKNKRIMEDAFESFIGAMYLYFNHNSSNKYELLTNKIKELIKYDVPNHIIKDLLEVSGDLENLSYGYSICSKFMINLLEKNIDWTELIRVDNNFKDQILKYYQQNFKMVPKYNCISKSGPPHDSLFTMSVVDEEGKIIGEGKSKTKKEAEQIASKNALIKLGVL